VPLENGGVKLVNDADRHPWVGGNAAGMGQAEVHSGRWMLIKDVVDQEVTEQILDEVEADLTKVIRQEGFGT
jgi:hypothetical protein